MDLQGKIAVVTGAGGGLGRALATSLARRRGSALAIVNISSLFGLVAAPGNVACCAGKFAVRGFSEVLRMELADTPVGVTLVHPGGVATSIARNAPFADDVSLEQAARDIADFEKLLKMPPGKAGEVIVSAIEKRRPRVIVGSDAKFLALLQRLAPVSTWKIARRLI